MNDLRAVIARSLGDERLRDVPADELLLRSGRITSIELVSLIVDLEKHYGVTIPDGAVTPENLTLEHLAVLAKITSPSPAATPLAPATEPSFMHRPLYVLAAAMVFFFAIDRALELTIRGPLAARYHSFLENGERLYPWSGGFSQDDFAFAAKHHRALTQSPPPGEKRVLFLGDSGTIGSFFPSGASIPAQTERALRAAGVPARVENFGWFGRLLAKDLMLLETTWDQKYDAVVFTVGDEYFSREKVDLWIGSYRHCTVNLPLYRAFTTRIPAAERGPFERLDRKLAEGDEKHWGAARRFAFEHFAIAHYRPFLQWIWREDLLPSYVLSPVRRDLRVTQKLRFFADQPRSFWQAGLLDRQIDDDQLAVLESTINLLAARGVKTVLYVEPFAPTEWKHEAAKGRKTALDLAREISAKTGAKIVDTTWSVGQGEFLDSQAHYLPSAMERIGLAVGTGLAEVLQ